jgi:hypothetical protein
VEYNNAVEKRLLEGDDSIEDKIKRARDEFFALVLRRGTLCEEPNAGTQEEEIPKTNPLVEISHPEAWADIEEDEDTKNEEEKIDLSDEEAQQPPKNDMIFELPTIKFHGVGLSKKSLPEGMFTVGSEGSSEDSAEEGWEKDENDGNFSDAHESDDDFLQRAFHGVSREETKNNAQTKKKQLLEEQKKREIDQLNEMSKIICLHIRERKPRIFSRFIGVKEFNKVSVYPNGKKSSLQEVTFKTTRNQPKNQCKLDPITSLNNGIKPPKQTSFLIYCPWSNWQW